MLQYEWLSSQRPGRANDLAMAQSGSLAGSRCSGGLEDDLWLIPIEDRRGIDSEREGMLEGFTLGNYLVLVEYTGHQLRQGKATLSAELAGNFDRLRSSAEKWRARLMKLSGGHLLGRFFLASREKLRAAVERFCLRHAPNLSGCSI